jgi:hypothetical protein
MQTMKPLAAFAMGLWTGAVVVGVVAMWRFREGPFFGRPGISEAVATDLQTKSAEIQRLRQEQANLAAETQRLKQTLAELNSSRAPRSAWTTRPTPPVKPPRPRSPEDSAAPTVREPPATGWIEEAVNSGDATAMPRMEALAMKNNETALEGLALLADLDNADALTRVWTADTLDATNRVKAARFLGATAEINPNLELLLGRLATDKTADLRLWRALLDGLADPTMHVSLGRSAAVPLPPRVKPDWDLRLRLFDTIRGLITDERLQTYAERARADLLERGARAAAAE